jgi:hypothetical protein
MKIIRKGKMKEENWTVLWCEDVESMVEAINDKEFIWPLILRGVRWLMDEGRSSSMILECRLIDGRENCWISVSTEDVEPTLGKLIDYRLEKEEYEECAAIRDLLSEWRSREVPAASQLEGDQINSGANEDK